MVRGEDSHSNGSGSGSGFGNGSGHSEGAAGIVHWLSIHGQLFTEYDYMYATRIHEFENGLIQYEVDLYAEDTNIQRRT